MRDPSLESEIDLAIMIAFFLLNGGVLDYFKLQDRYGMSKSGAGRWLQALSRSCHLMECESISPRTFYKIKGFRLVE